MRFSIFRDSFSWALSLACVATSSSVDYTVRNAPGASTIDTYQAIRRELVKAAVEKRQTVLKNSTTLDKSWNDAVLLKFGAEKTVNETDASSLTVNAGAEIVCTTCFVKGVATAELSFSEDFNVSTTIDQTLSSVHDKVENFTETVDDYFVNYTKMVLANFDDGIDVEDFAFPTFPFNFSMEVPTIPECNLGFTFDNMELYMEIDTILSVGATYELRLFATETPIGISITPDLVLGVVVAIDLILTITGEIDISSGFHILLNDGAAINIALFGDDVSDITFNGGKYEFLPVTIESAGVVFSAVLRVGLHAGFSVVTPTLPEVTVFGTTLKTPSVGGGIEVGVFVNFAEFTTNVTLAPEEDCKLSVVQSYQMALGAQAGATIAFDTHTWGPMATASVPIFYTEIASLCAIQKTATSSTIAAATGATAAKREEMITSTLTSAITHTGVTCMTSGLVNCPNSAQNTTQSVEVSTATVTVPSGSEATWPETTGSIVTNDVTFGANANELAATTGAPVSYVPPPPTASSTGGSGGGDDVFSAGLNGEVGGVSKKVIVGVSVGVGVPVLIALIAGITLFIRRRKAKPHSPIPERTPMIAEPYLSSGPVPGERYHDKPGKPSVDITDLGSR